MTVKQLSLMEMLGPPDTVTPDPAKRHAPTADDTLRLICRICRHKLNRDGRSDPDWDTVIIDAFGNYEVHIGFNEIQLKKRFPNHIWLDEWPHEGGENERAERLRLMGMMSAYWIVDKAQHKDYGSYSSLGVKLEND